MSESTVAKTENMLTKDTETLASITSFQDAMQALSDAGINTVDYSEEFGDGFQLMKGNDQKGTLVGVPFVILGIKFAEGDYDESFAILHVVTEDGRKCIIVDGGSGVCAQAKAMAAKGITAGVLVKNGLTRSDYDYVDEKGKTAPATTFYLSN
jgi:hypothetical protein